LERTYSNEVQTQLQQVASVAAGFPLPDNLNTQVERDALFAQAFLLLARRLDLGVRVLTFVPTGDPGVTAPVGNTGGISGPVGNTGGITGP
jgi:hypothetical protein